MNAIATSETFEALFAKIREATAAARKRMRDQITVRVKPGFGPDIRGAFISGSRILKIARVVVTGFSRPDLIDLSDCWLTPEEAIAFLNGMQPESGGEQELL